MLKELTKIEMYFIIISYKELLVKEPYCKTQAIFEDLKYSLERFKAIAKETWGTGWFEKVEEFLQTFEERGT